MITVEKETIAAISTPIGYGGIGIVRLSGPESALIARKIFKKGNQKDWENQKKISDLTTKTFLPRRLQHGYIVDPETKTIPNEVLMVFMPSPNSYTREDVIEIQAHGGTAALKSILEIVIKNGARLAEPGEFTRRAYINGRIDLSQAEAVIDIINAKNEASLKIASRNLEGDVGKITGEIRNGLLEIEAMIESQIDFPEEVEETIDIKEIQKKISQEILEPIKKILEGYKYGHFLREGAKIVIQGRTNVGKSSLLNRFMERERAIVTPFPGTTRDSIEESLPILGVPAVVVDTAGRRNTKDPIEKIGIDRSRELALNADLVLFMIDAATGVVEEDETLYEEIKKKEKILVINKNDLIRDDIDIKVPQQWQIEEMQYTSAKYGNGIKELKEKIYKKLVSSKNLTETEVVPTLRQKNLFERAQNAIDTAIRGLDEKIQPELIVIDIKEAMAALNEVTGDFVKQDILDEIFSRFCIGK